MSVRINKNFIKKLERSKETMGKERDRLREMMNDILDVEEHYQTAYEDLERLIDSLSEIV